MKPYVSLSAAGGVSARGLLRITLILLCLVLPLPRNAWAQPSQGGGTIDFPASLLPQIPASLPTIKLTAQAPPEAFLRQTLTKQGVNLQTIQPLIRTPLLKAQPISDQMVGVIRDDKIHAYWNKQTGDAEVFPQFDKLRGEEFRLPGDPRLQKATTLARQVFARRDILPRDATSYTLGPARPLVGATAQRASATARPTESKHLLYLTYVPVFRSVQGHRVYGPGSRAMLAMGNDGTVQGFVRRWKGGRAAGQAREKRTPAQVREALLKLLEPMSGKADVKVLAAEVAYYDEDADALTPVYRVAVRVHPLDTGATPAKTAGDVFVAKYMAFGDAPLPKWLSQAPGPQPAAPPRAAVNVPREVAPGDPLVGRYVVRDAEWGFVDEANAFWNGLTVWGGGAAFTNAQYFWAYPFEYTTSSHDFVNSVHVALTEGHGANWLFTTRSNCCDTVNIDAITPAQGYGAATGGRLAYWIIHSCSVVPSAADRDDWWKPWFDVFQGLHSVMGSRTSMFFDGGAVNYPFGVNLRFGAPVVAAWFNATLSYYSGDPPVDRPSSVSVCGHENDNVYNIAALPAAGCLHNLWQPD